MRHSWGASPSLVDGCPVCWQIVEFRFLEIWTLALELDIKQEKNTFYLVSKHGIDTGPWWEATVTTGTPAGDTGQALGPGLGLRIELDQ